MSKPLAHFLDMMVTLSFLVALLFVDVKFVFATYLLLTAVGEGAKAMNAILVPLIDALRVRAKC